ncbi:hypothetical protein [Verminephrobacter aporrectodeae]|uniref:hypothetical protein n=1 Tax=Verminephrobacter aporrectodeae TaxID=1110389 RepID=UPI002244519C|nr:hypothetical protein [Verminephrobacter aporrectodeae]
MRKIIYCLCGGVLVCIVGAAWSILWIDGLLVSDLPGRYPLAAARLFWSMTPAIDRNADADRALKLSWLKASTDTNRKDGKQTSNIIDVLSSESLFIANYIKSNYLGMSDGMSTKAITQSLIYLNRIDLYQNFQESGFEKRSKELASRILRTDPVTQENWHREMMIRSYMRGDHETYMKSRTNFANRLNKHGKNVPADFQEGVLLFYDGILSCLAKKPDAAQVPLMKASKIFSSHRQLTASLLLDNLNMLLLWRGRDSGTACNDYLSMVVSSGA